MNKNKTTDVYKIMQRPTNKHMKHLLDKMAEMVELDSIEDVNLNHVKWFELYTWTEEQQDEFRDYMRNYLKNNKAARDELLNLSILNEHVIDKATDEFIFMWGWKVNY